MKFSTTFVVVLVSSVITSTIATDSISQTQEPMHNVSFFSSAQSSCSALLQGYYTTNSSVPALYDVVQRCLDISQPKRIDQANVPAPRSLIVDLPHLPARLSIENSTSTVELPSLQLIEHAMKTMEEKIAKLAEHLDSIQDLDHADQIDLTVCGLQLHGANCEDGHFLPKTGLLRHVASLGLRLSGKHLRIEKAFYAMRQTKAHQIRIAKSMAKMIRSLAMTYPPSGHDTATWIKTYSLVRTNVDLVSDVLNMPMLAKLEPTHRPAFFRSSVLRAEI
jgi:hypothetical protein